MTSRALELLEWLAPHLARSGEDIRVRALAAMIRLGLDPVRAGMPPRHTWEQYVQLAEAGWSGAPAALPAVVDLVGADVLLADPDNAGEWAAVAGLLDDRSDMWRSSPYCRNIPVRDWIQRFVDAGRGPGFARAIIERANSAGVRPDVIGYGPDITPALFSDAVDAGLTAPAEMDALRGCGLTTAEAVAKLDGGRVAPGAVVAAYATSLPEDRWADILPGLPASWFPVAEATWPERGLDPVKVGILQRPFMWEQLRTLVDNGWSDLTTYQVTFGFGHGKHRVTLSAADLVEMSAILPSPDTVDTWVNALLAGKVGAGWRDAALPPLGWRDTRDALFLAARTLPGLGVAPSHLGTYRRAGCRSVAEVVEVVRFGVTPARAEHLLKARPATEKHWGRSPRIRNVTALLAAHRDIPV